jgi:hypothetical protein
MSPVVATIDAGIVLAALAVVVGAVAIAIQVLQGSSMPAPMKRRLITASLATVAVSVVVAAILLFAALRPTQRDVGLVTALDEKASHGCFGPGRTDDGTRSRLTISNRVGGPQRTVYRRIIQCKTRYESLYRFDLSLSEAAQITALNGRFVVDEEDAPDGAEVRWTVRYGDKEICTPRARVGHPGHCRIARPIDVVAGAQLTIEQVVVERPGAKALFAGMHRPALRLRE